MSIGPCGHASRWSDICHSPMSLPSPVHIPLELELGDRSAGSARGVTSTAHGFDCHAIRTATHPPGPIPAPPSASNPDASVFATALPHNCRIEASRGSHHAVDIGSPIRGRAGSPSVTPSAATPTHLQILSRTKSCGGRDTHSRFERTC